MTDTEILTLLLVRTPLVDLRAPVEYTQGTLPGATSIPLLNDDERARIGVAYKTEGTESAVALGHSIISGLTKERRVDAWAAFARAHPQAVFFCFRGGLRSQSVRDALARERGVRVPVLDGGYKRVRGLLLKQLQEIAQRESFHVVSGFTGAGKTRLLVKLQTSRRVCDLEALACHRGSAFGGGGPQPAQIDFENTLALRLLEIETGPRPIVLEDESRMIGARTMPLELYSRLAASPIYLIEATPESRARELVATYASDHGLIDGGQDAVAIEALRVSIQRNLQAISRRLGGFEHKQLSLMSDEACAEHARSGSLDAHLPWVLRLLERYYDKLYLSHLERERDRVVFRGSFEEVEAVLR